MEEGFKLKVDCPTLVAYEVEVIKEREVEEGRFGYDRSWRSGLLLVFDSPAGLQYFNFSPMR